MGRENVGEKVGQMTSWFRHWRRKRDMRRLERARHKAWLDSLPPWKTFGRKGLKLHMDGAKR